MNHHHFTSTLRLRDLEFYGKRFILARVTIQDDPRVRYAAIPGDAVGANGRILRPLNGGELHLRDTAQACAKACENGVRVDMLMADGVPLLVAAVMVHDGSTREQAEAKVAACKERARAQGIEIDY